MRKVAILLIAVLVASLVSGCAKPIDEKEKVTIYLRNYADHKGIYSADEPGADYDSMTRYMADKFIAQYDKYDVTIETEYFALEDEKKYIADKYGQPDATDIVLQDSFVNLGHIYEGRLVPLDDIITDEIRADVGEDFEELYTVRGKVYTAPFSRLPTVFAYNADLFRKAGLEEFITDENEIADWSIDEWDYILKTLKQNLPENVYPMMMYGTDSNGDMIKMMMLRMFGNPFFDENGNSCLNNESGIKALTWMRDIVEKGYCPPGSWNIGQMDCFYLYCNKQLAIYISNNVINDMPAVSDIDTRFVLYPSVSGRGLSLDFVYTFGIFDNGDEKRLEVSKDFLKFLYSDKELLGLGAAPGTLPAFTSVAKEYAKEIPMLDSWLGIQDTRIDFTNSSPNYPGIRAVFYPEITAMLKGDQSPEETARKLDEKINAAIEEGRSESKIGG